MSELGTESLEASLGAAFGDAPVEALKPVAKTAEAPPDAPLEIEEDPADLLAGEEPEPVASAAEDDPEFELEIEPGRPERMPLTKLKELAARGAKAGRGFEENARVREALHAQHQQVQLQAQFQQAVSGDIAGIQALEQQLQAYERMDWNAAYDADPFQALKLKEQRDQLREQRAARIQDLNAKQQQFQGYVKETQHKALAAENEALLAKVPAWRNAEKAAQERGEIAGALKSHYGFTAQEISGVMDHRHILVARDAAAYRKLLANKDAKVKQAREAAPMAKPGAAAPATNGKVEFNKARGKLRELGSKGNHRAQENLAAAMFERAFK